MRAYAAMIGGMALASCASSAAVISAVPNSKQVYRAVDDDDFRRTFETVSCDGNAKCYNARPNVKVRNVACLPLSERKANCTYDLYSFTDGWLSKRTNFEVGIGLDGKTAWLLSNSI